MAYLTELSLNPGYSDRANLDNRDRTFDAQIHNPTKTTARNYPDPFDNPEEFADYIKSRIESLSQSNQNQRDKLFDILTYIQRRIWDINKIQNFNLWELLNIKQVILNEIDCLFQELDEMK